MVMSKRITVKIAYASPDRQCVMTLDVEEGATIRDVINQSGVLIQFPEIDLTLQKVGIFSEAKNLADKVKAGDRVEIYRPLVMDPKDARKKRATRR